MNEKGSIQLPLAICLFVVAITAIGFVLRMHEWRHQMETQLRIDRCVSEKARQLKAWTLSIEAGNDRIRALRGLLLASTLLPESRAPIEAALRAQSAWQQVILARWRAASLVWLAKRGCDGKDLPWPLPGPPWVTESPDLLGPKPVVWPQGVLRHFTVTLLHLPRRSAAKVWEESNGKNSWHAAWVRPGASPN